jgi:hypothetical protein
MMAQIHPPHHLPAGFYRHEPPAVELFRQVAMPHPPSHHRRLRGARALARRSRLLTALAAIVIALAACQKKTAAPPSIPSVNPSTAAAAAAPLARQLAAARLAAAKARSEKFARDEALALLISALKVDPGCSEAAALIRQMLTETLWHIPIASISHPWPVQHLAFAPPSSLWVSLAEPLPDGFNTTVLWNTEALKIQGVLFPARGAATHHLVVGHNAHALVVQRGSGPTAVTLLCAAASLRPIADLGPLPADLTPQAVIVSSANGLLIAHPGAASATDPRLVWRIRDAATGGVIRSSEPLAGDAARPLAAQLDSQRLRVLHADGSLLDVPVSPVDPARSYPPGTPLALEHAQMHPQDGAALVLLGRGADLAPVRRFYQIDRLADGDAPCLLPPAPGAGPTNPAAVPGWVMDLPWSRQPSVWTGLLRDHGNPEEPAPICIQAASLSFCNSPRAPIHSASPITAAAFGPGVAILGTDHGGVVMHRFLPPPHTSATTHASDPIDSTALGLLAEILSGIRFEDTGGTFVGLTVAQRLGLLDKLPPELATKLLPGLDFTATLAELKAACPREAPVAALLPLWDRLARSDHSAKAWPRLLELAQPLADTRWHQDLTEAAALRAVIQPRAEVVRTDDPSPWLAQLRIREAFGKRDEPAILREIQAAGGRGPAAATALALALASESPAWIDACLQSATALPPVLRVLGQSRIAWLQQRMADAISPWPDEFPDYERLRLTEDWDGWEQADFAPCYAAHLQAIHKQLAGYEVAAATTADERAALAARLLDPATRGIIGRRRLADNCLKAALALAAFPDHSAATFQLANRARSLGAPPEPCLRAEALALTRLGDYAGAHPRWVTLLTEHPVATHLSGDYAEAAYTAFENGDASQAMAILTTGIQRFPDDPNFALRAGWIALLTGNGARAYQFLLAGLRVGYPADKHENSCLMLAVAAAQAGFPEEAATHYHNLLELAPVWAETTTIDALEWPEELKASLLDLAQ